MLINNKSRTRKKRGIACLLLCVCFCCGACKGEPATPKEEEAFQDTLFAMDTYMTFTAYGSAGEEAVAAAIEEVKRLDAMLSTEMPDSEVARLNQTGSMAVSDEVGELFTTGLAAYQSTKGLFDFTIYPLVRLWGFTTGEYYVPAKEEIMEKLENVGADKVSYQAGRLTLAPGQELDFGGIAKGYASARVMDIYREHGVASGLVSLGGNVQALNQRPDGKPWRIAIQDPQGGAGEYFAILSLQNKAVVTSGGYERYFEKDGTSYIHIIDPHTGYPAESGLLSVTVVSEDGAWADALSTALFLMGLEKATSYWEEAENRFEMVIMTKEREVYITEGLAEDFETAGNFKQETQIIKRGGIS